MDSIARAGEEGIRGNADAAGGARRTVLRGPGVESDKSDILATMVRLTATDAARSFSDVLNRVAAGEEFEIVRNGAPVARLGPAPVHAVPGARLNDLLARLPAVDDAFTAELRAIRAQQGIDEDPWAS